MKQENPFKWLNLIMGNANYTSANIGNSGFVSDTEENLFHRQFEGEFLLKKIEQLIGKPPVYSALYFNGKTVEYLMNTDHHGHTVYLYYLHSLRLSDYKQECTDLWQQEHGLPIDERLKLINEDL